LEDNFLVWDGFKLRFSWYCENTYGSLEEFAVASLIWDLYDPISLVDQNHSGEEDWIDLSIHQLWDALTDESTNSLNSIKDLYDSLVKQGIGGTDSDNDGRTDLEEVFILHGFYADTGDQTYQVNESIG
jgi:hypothetical protein